MTGARQVVIGRAALLALDRAAYAAGPHECCGALIGRMGHAGVAIVGAEPLDNRAEAPASRYAVAPEDVLRVQRRARTGGLDIVGFFHSHPASSSVPSATDIESAVPGYVYVIVGCGVTRESTDRIRAWLSPEPDAPLEEVRLMRSGS